MAPRPAAPTSAPGGRALLEPRSGVPRVAPPSRAGAPLSAPAPAPAPSPAPGPGLGPLSAEQHWLAELFKGTPVQVLGQKAGREVRLDVPLRFAFDAGSSQPKPPLQAVLKRVGQSLKRQPTARLALAAPGPGALERQHAMQAQLTAMGLAAHRVSMPAAAHPASASSVQLQLVAATAAIQRLHDRHLPGVSAGSVVAPPGVPAGSITAPAAPAGKAMALTGH